MSCVGGCCNEKLTRSDLDNWISSITSVLTSNMGREKFLEFLISRNLDDSVLTVCFWEKCNKIQKKLENEKGLRRNEIIQELTELVKYADDHIDFDFAQMEMLQQLPKEKDYSKACDTLSRAKTSASQLLHNEHRIFSEILKKEFNNNCH